MQPMFTQQDHCFMKIALGLAQQGQFTTTPNPNVGCVLVKNNQIIGQGFHYQAGEPHAEVMALRDAELKGHNVVGATAYVTLEPCSHFGRTPPCALGLINAKVGKVIVAMADPNPQVVGRGLQMLQEAGIETAVGLLAAEAEEINKGFLKRMRTGLPFVQLKLAMSLDGRTAMSNGESKWITGVEARADVQVGRAKACAILSTSSTVLADDPMLNVRWEQLPEKVRSHLAEDSIRQPVRVILDWQGKVPQSAQLFRQQTPVWLMRNVEKWAESRQHFVEEMTTSRDLMSILKQLAERQINYLWVEAGAILAGELIQFNLVDELILYVAPKLLGEQARGLCYLPNLHHLQDAPEWRLQSMHQIGQDIKLVYRQKNRETK